VGRKFWEPARKVAIMAEQRNVAEFFSTLSEEVCAITGCDILIYSLDDPAQQSVCNHLWQQGKLSTISSDSSDRAMPAARMWDIQQPLLVQDVASEAGFLEVIKLAKEVGMGSFCGLPLSTGDRRIGALVFGNTRTQAFREDDLAFLGNVARLVALTLENAQALAALQKERDSLIGISETLFLNQPLDELLLAFAEPIRPVVHQDFTCVLLCDKDGRYLRRRPLDFELALPIHESDERIPLEYFPYGQALLDRQTKHYSLVEIGERNPALAERMQKLGARSLSVVPLMSGARICGVLALGSRRQNAFVAQDRSFLEQVAVRIGAAIDHASACREIIDLTERLEGERVCLQEEISSSHNFEEIIGESPNLRSALTQVETVAPSNATVLILGETGTGKELVARARDLRQSVAAGQFRSDLFYRLYVFPVQLPPLRERASDIPQLVPSLRAAVQPTHG